MSHERSLRRRIDDALAASALFAGGSVPAFEFDELQTLAHSEVARVRFESHASPVKSIVYKCSRPGFGYLAIREARFYRAAGGRLLPGMAPRHYLAAETSDSATLLLEDLGGSHRPCAGSTPTFEEASAFVRALARLHAAGHLRPELRFAWSTTMGDGAQETVEARLRLIPSLTARLAEASPHVIDGATCDLLVRVATSANVRAAVDCDPVVLHGDAHYWNGLYSAGEAALIDWGSTCLGPSAVDIAHAVALNLAPVVRMNWEKPLLHAYTDSLNAAGVPRSYEETLSQYAVGVLYAVTVPIRQWAGGVPEAVWRPLLRNASAAVAELDVEALL